MLAAGVPVAGAGAAAAAWSLGADPTATVGAGLAVGLTAGVGAAFYLGQKEIGRLSRELARLKSAQRHVEAEIEMAKDGMSKVRQSLRDDEGANDLRMAAMADEVAVLQKLVVRMQNAAAVGEALPKPDKTERRTAYGMSDEQVLGLVRAAVADGAVDLFMQPVVTLPQRRRRYYECFSRIPDGRGGVLAADAYVGPAAAADLLAPIDNLLLFRAVQLARRARSQNAQVGFFCNVSRHTLEDAGFLGDFIEFLEENEELGPSLILEIAQADWDPANMETKRFMDDLTRLGVRFSMDRVEDFDLDEGQLKRRGFRFLKVSAAELLAEDGPGANALKRRLGRQDIALIVEKVEQERDLVELLEHDIDLGQGYLFGEPKAPIAATSAA